MFFSNRHRQTDASHLKRLTANFACRATSAFFSLSTVAVDFNPVHSALGHVNSLVPPSAQLSHLDCLVPSATEPSPRVL
ncbi:hypothetical protein ACQRIU_003439 [Beauveria bassiana]